MLLNDYRESSSFSLLSSNIIAEVTHYIGSFNMMYAREDVVPACVICVFHTDEIANFCPPDSTVWILE